MSDAFWVERRAAEWAEAGRLALHRLLPVLVVLVLLQVAAHGHLLFGTILTNHTFPNTWGWDFPSYRTVLDGRWGADLVYAAQSGRGIPLLLMLLAIPLQILNGVLFARLLEIESRWLTFLLAGLVVLHPFFSDYYGFAGDHVFLVLGDTLILLGFLLAVAGVRAWVDRPSRLAATPDGEARAPRVTGIRLLQALAVVALAGTLIQLGVSTYQPKLGLIATLGLLLVLAQVARWDGSGVDFRKRVQVVAGAALAAVLGVVSYFLAFRAMQGFFRGEERWADLLDSDHAVMRQSLMDPSRVVEQLASLPTMAREWLLEPSGWTSPVLAPLPLVFAGAFLVLLAWRLLLVTRPLPAVLAAAGAALVVVLLPVAILVTYLVSQFAYSAWRFWVGVPYANAFFVVMTAWLLGEQRARIERRRATWSSSRGGIVPVLMVGRLIVGAAALLLLYRFVLVNAEIGQAAQMRTLFETELISGIARRVEARLSEADPSASDSVPVVIVGEREMDMARYLSTQVIRSNLVVPAFVHYRHVEFLNFYIGRDALRVATEEEKTLAQIEAAGMPAWPAEHSVRMVDGRVVVVLQAQ